MIVAITQPEDVGEARRCANERARACGFDDTTAGNVALIATELAGNVAKHAGRGTLAIANYDDAQGRGVEILAIDAGPGMRDLARCLRDGYSTAGSPGTGLGAIQRLSTAFDVFTRPGAGTVAMARVATSVRHVAAHMPRFQIGAVAAPYPGESISGDGWHSSVRDGVCRLFMADGTGHGPLAAAAATTGVALFDSALDLPPVAAIERISSGLAATRGAAIALATIDIAARQVGFVGIGNIAGALIAGDHSKHMVSMNGTAGHRVPRIREFTYPFMAPDPIVVLHSDGVSARWDIDAYPGLIARHASVIAGVLYRDHTRQRDDATVLVVKVVPP